MRRSSAAAPFRRCVMPARGWTTTSRPSAGDGTACAGSCWISTRRTPASWRRERSPRSSSSTSRSTPIHATRAASPLRPMSATSRPSTATSSAARAGNPRRHDTTGPLRARGRVCVRDALQRAAGAEGVARADGARRRPQGEQGESLACALRRLELGRRLASGARDRDQRVQPRHRTARQQTPLAARRRQRLRTRAPPSAGCSCPAGRSRRKPWRPSGRKCSEASPAAARSSRTATR